jgi:hypothetical protein
MRFRIEMGVAVIAALMFGASAGTAQTLTCTFQFTGSGTLGTQTFTNASVMITAVSTTVRNTGELVADSSSASLSIAGIGNFQFTGQTLTFETAAPYNLPPGSNVTETIGFGVLNGGMVSVNRPMTNTTLWNMLTSIGPLTSGGAILNWNISPALTTGGTLNIYTANPQVTFQATLTGTSLPPALNRVGVFAHVTNGGYWDTKINLINTSSAPISATVNLYADNGAAWSVPVSITQQGNTQTSTTSSANVTVNPNGTVIIATTPNPSVSSVWGWADVQASGPLSGFAILRSSPTGGNPSEATVPLQTSFPSSVILPFDNTTGYVMGVALANLATGFTSITATVWDDSGNQLGVQPITISGNGHTAFGLTDQIPVTAGKRGIIKLQNPIGGISGLGLRFSPAGPFTDVPVFLQ